MQMERQRLQQTSFGIAVEEPVHGGFAREGPSGGEDGCRGQTAQLRHP